MEERITEGHLARESGRQGNTAVKEKYGLECMPALAASRCTRSMGSMAEALLSGD